MGMVRWVRTLLHKEHQTSTSSSSSSSSVCSWHFRCSSLLLQGGSVLDLCQLTVLGAHKLFFFLTGVCFQILSNCKPLYQTTPYRMEPGFSFFLSLGLCWQMTHASTGTGAQGPGQPGDKEEETKELWQLQSLAEISVGKKWLGINDRNILAVLSLPLLALTAPASKTRGRDEFYSWKQRHLLHNCLNVFWGLDQDQNKVDFVVAWVGWVLSRAF